MELKEIIQNEYFDKIILTLIPIILKGIFGNKTDTKKYLNLFINYLLPIFTILWINIDGNISSNKLTMTLLCANFSFIVLNYLHRNIKSHSEIISKFVNAEDEKIKDINNINATQIEKIKAINENQKYILEELSKINDRFINYIFNSKK